MTVGVPRLSVNPTIHEASIGHKLTTDALELGFGPAVGAYKAALIGEQHDPASALRR
jgi:pyridoxine 5'-phosphate synthase PdxJ